MSRYGLRWPWAGRPCTWPARDARPGGGPSDWLPQPAAWRDRLGHPHALGMASLSAGAGRVPDRPVRLGRSSCSTAPRRSFVSGAPASSGSSIPPGSSASGRCSTWGGMAELGVRCHDIFQEARDRGDRYMVATPGPFVGTVVRLAEDDVEGARRFARQGAGTMVASRLSHPASQFLLWKPLY